VAKRRSGRVWCAASPQAGSALDRFVAVVAGARPRMTGGSRTRMFFPLECYVAPVLRSLVTGILVTKTAVADGDQNFVKDSSPSLLREHLVILHHTLLLSRYVALRIWLHTLADGQWRIDLHRKGAFCCRCVPTNCHDSDLPGTQALCFLSD
jgi:hypothetical protein